MLVVNMTDQILAAHCLATATICVTNQQMRPGMRSGIPIRALSVLALLVLTKVLTRFAFDLAVTLM